MLIVQKYGGTSLETGDRVRAAARRLDALARQGHRVVAVVSAQGDLTERLLRRAGEMTQAGCPRETDALLAAGEQLSAALMAMALENMGRKALSLTGWQAGIRTDGRHGDARIRHIDCGPILAALEEGRIPVVAGFQGLGPEGDITTLGRGGSDTTAVALAAWLGADKCQIFTDVDGVYDRDPRLFPDARKYDRISWDAMLALAEGGAQVLHGPCVRLARERRIPIEVLSAFRDVPGTLVEDLE